MSRVRPITVVGMALLLTACSPTSSVGVTARDGDVVAMMKLCDGEELDSFELWGGPDGEELWWRIESTGPNYVDEVVIGEVPPSFTETDPLVVDVFSEEEAWIVTVRDGTEIPGGVFVIPNLSEDEIILEGHGFTPAEWASLSCDY